MMPPVELVFTRPAALLNLNDRPTHWAVKAKAVKLWRYRTFLAAMETGLTPAQRRRPPSTVHLSIGVRDPGRRRDGHNFTPTVKACIDGLVDAAIWPDDDGRWVTVVDTTFHKGTDVRIRIEDRPA